jgi:prefoldin subunit 5
MPPDKKLESIKKDLQKILENIEKIEQHAQKIENYQKEIGEALHKLLHPKEEKKRWWQI